MVSGNSDRYAFGIRVDGVEESLVGHEVFAGEVARVHDEAAGDTVAMPRGRRKGKGDGFGRDREALG